MKLLKVVVKIVYSTIGKSRGRKRRKTSFSFLWELSYQYNVSHDKAGGVTDGSFRVVYAYRDVSYIQLP